MQNSRIWRTTTLAALVAAFGPLSAAAQTCTTNPCTVGVTASSTVADVMQLTLSSTTTDLGSPTATEYGAGHMDASGPTSTVKSNRPWRVTVVGNAANFSYSAPAASGLTNTKSAADLKWGTTAGTYGSNMGSAAQLSSGNGTAGASQQIFFRTQWAWATDVPGTYSLVVNFTLSGP
jgi:hypothetical protein